MKAQGSKTNSKMKRLKLLAIFSVLILSARCAKAATLLVDVNGTNPVPPFADWGTAATNIQDAVDNASDGDLILVTNGIYQAGARVTPDSATNRVVVTRPVVLQSVNGPLATVIDCATEMRCVYLGGGAQFVGFTLTNGYSAGNGGGVFCESAAVVSNCVIAGCSAANNGGGVSGGTLYGCTLAGNSASAAGGGANGSTLTDCTLSGNYAHADNGNQSGGGAENCILNACVLNGNYARNYGGAADASTLNRCLVTNNWVIWGVGGGIYNSTADDCLFFDNSANAGGGAEGSSLTNCTLTGNYCNEGEGEFGGGADGCSLNNCLLYFNNGNDDNYYNSTLNYCCTTPLPGGGSGNFTNTPQFVDWAGGDFHLQSNSPCINAGNNSFVTGLSDLDGKPRIQGLVVDVGAFEFPVPIAIAADYTNVAVGFTVHFISQVFAGNTSNSFLDFGDGTVLTNQFSAPHSWAAPGNFPVTLTVFSDHFPAGISASVTVHVVEGNYFVALASTNPVAPYHSWDTAATNIQEAVDAAAVGGTVSVTNGIYSSGGHPVYSLSQSNRVAVTKPLTLRSVNGPLVTVIEGYHEAGQSVTFNSTRCVYLTNGAALIGFTVSNGGTQPGNDQDGRETIGGGVWCESSAAIVSNCVITGCTAELGGGILSGTIIDSTLTNNFGHYAGGGASGCVAINCLFTRNQSAAGGYADGGGADSSTLTRCILTDNVSDYAGGAVNSTLDDCALYGNSSGSAAGGAANCTLNNCTLTGNTAAGSGGGATGSTLNNCIVYFNSVNAASGETNCYGCTLNFSCTTPLPDTNFNSNSGTNNITTPPQLADNFHLNAASPCIGAGSTNFPGGTDIDGEPWLNPPSIGCDEFYPGATGDLAVLISQDFLAATPGYALNFNAQLAGRASASVWDFGDGTMLSNQVFAVNHVWNSPGTYAVIFTAFNDDHPEGVSATNFIRIVAQPFYFVNVACTNPVAPYLTWDTSATNIQDAIDVAIPSSGTVVFVTNGIYQAGSRTSSDGFSNRIVVNKPFTVQGTGSAVMIDGTAAMRCVYVSAGAQLVGLILTNGNCIGDGGGAWCESGGVISNCVVTTCRTTGSGGGVSGGIIFNSLLENNFSPNGGGGVNGATLWNCVLSHNSAGEGGGAESSTLNNCTITFNSAYNGGGAVNSVLGNCIAYFNSAPGGANFAACTLNFSCTTPLPANGTNNFTDVPQLADAEHLAATSPCLGAGNTNFVSGTDIDGEAWLNPPSVGCDEFYAGAATGELSASVSADYPAGAAGLTLHFSSLVFGHASSNAWSFGDGTTAANSLAASHAFAAPGDYTVVFTAFNDSHPGGVSATQIVHIVLQPVAYVSQAGVNPVLPYDSWDTAATNIQDAVDAVIAGGTVFVTNGVYQTGGRVVAGLQTNRVAVTKPVTVAGVSGPSVTTIVGNPVIGDGAVRGVYLAAGATLTGFTVTQGAATLGGTEQENSGGGIYCADNSATVSNCFITANAVAGGGGGVMRGTINNCIITSNTATYFQYYGGGAGAHSAVLRNCLIAGNSGGWSGGGAANSTLNNCTVVSNWSGYYGGAFDACFATNCIVYYNTGDNGVNSYFDHCDRTPDPGGAGNITDEPLFADITNGDFRLQNVSPCVNAGDNTAVAGSTDLDENLRIFAGTVDMGAFELQSLPALNVAIQSDFTNVPIGYYLPLHALIAPHVPAVVHWDFGDGTSADGPTNITHQWTSPGDYAVVLTAEDVNSNYSVSNSATLVIRVAGSFTYYVDAGSTNPVAPYDSWETAATKIQDAVDAAFPSPRSTVIVTNGTYWNLSRYAPNIGQSTVIVDKPVMVRSVNGPAATVIWGLFYAQRGAYLADGAVMSGFTLTSGSQTYRDGGGVSCETTGALLTNCVINGNSCYYNGGGISGGTLINCTISGNSSFSGGGTSGSVLVNCILNGNSAWLGGAADGCSLTNCTITRNSANYVDGIGGTRSSTLANCIVADNSQGNYDDSSALIFCCTTPLPAGGTGNFTNNPLFVDAAGGDFHLQNISPCLNVGNNAAVATDTDFDGQPRIFGGTVDIGAYELQALPAWYVSIHLDSTNAVVGHALHLLGAAWPKAFTSLHWDFGDGTSAGSGMNIVHSWSAPGDYPVVLTVFDDTYPGGISATQLVHIVSPALAYVSITSTNPVAPFSSWDTAATNIQDAVDTVADGGMVIVSNGVYQTGGKIVGGSLSNRVAVTRPLILASVNGPQVTTILGNPEAGGNAMRGVYLAHNTTLSGFTVALGATTTAYDGVETENSGGGVYCEDASAVVNNCIITRNSAIANGGGVMRGTVTHSIVSSNSVYYYAFFGWGGGAAYCSMDNCLIVSNSVFLVGGGASSSTLNNCTVVGNYAYYYPSALDSCRATNCIIQFNSGLGQGICTYDHCCATSLSGNAGNFPDDPLFVDMTNGDFHLQTNSPCINAANIASFVGATDLDGRPRIFNGNADVGAFEFQSAEISSLASWLHRYGMPADGSADFTDSDGDGMNNRQEWLAGTDPTDPQSVLQMMPMSTGGGNAFTVTWQSVAGKNYFVQRSGDLAAQPFTTIMENITGQAGTTSFTDTTATNGNSFFYRVGVQ